MAQKQTIQIEITRNDWRALRIPWLTSVIAEALKDADVRRLEVKTVRNK